MTMNEPALRPNDISWEKKLAHLRELSEDDFRDNVIRPLFQRRGLKHLRDTCGPEEEGKDAIFEGTDSLARRLIYAIQTKKGNINKASKSVDNLLTAVTQLKTAIESDIYLTSTKQRVRPNCVILCASGEINQAARTHVHDNIKDSRLAFMDANDLIPLIDEHFSEFWLGIDAKLLPYLRALRRDLLAAGDTVVTVDLGSPTKGTAPITDDAYVTLFVHRITEEVEKKHGQVSRRAKFDQIPIASLLNRVERLVWMRGEGGSGKTTSLRRLAIELIDANIRDISRKRPIPVLLSAVRVATFVEPLAVQALAETQSLAAASDAALSTEELHSGRLVLLIDALDEVQDPDLRREALAKILQFHEQYPRCCVILTSRDYSSIKAIPEIQRFEKYEIDSLDLRQASKIVDRLATGRKLNKEDANEMLRRMQEVHGISLSPMLVTIFVATSDFQRRDIPPNITEIFAKYSELLLGRWDEKKGLSQQYEAKLKDAVLCAVAHEMHRYYVREISLNEFRALAIEYLKKRGYEKSAEDIVTEITSRSNLVRIEGDSVVFRHHILQEFFAGRGVDDSAQLAGVVADEWWRKPIVFHFGDRPKNVTSMAPLQAAANSLAHAERFEAGVTIGLSTQACYLSETAEKQSVVKWVIQTLAAALPSYAALPPRLSQKFPLHSFLFGYLSGRDAVACDCVSDIFKEIIAAERKFSADEEPEKEAWEREAFWAAVGLMEAGHAEDVVTFARRFRPTDNRLLLALHLGAFFISHHRISPPAQKRAAEEIAHRISGKIEYLIKDMSKEMRGYLLEMRDGQVVAHDAPDDAKSPTTELGDTPQ